MRVFFDHGAYFYINSKGREQEWIRLGPERAQAIEIAEALNELKKEARLTVLSELRTVDESVRLAVFDRDAFKCVYCGATSNLVPDHFIPYAMGGSSHKSNIVTACVPCNSSKGGRDPRDFILDMMGLRTDILRSILGKT